MFSYAVHLVFTIFKTTRQLLYQPIAYGHVVVRKCNRLRFIFQMKEVDLQDLVCKLAADDFLSNLPNFDVPSLGKLLSLLSSGLLNLFIH